MPTTRKRVRRRALPRDFAAIPLSERVRWILGMLIIDPDERPPRSAVGVIAWPSWQAWAECYSRCREAFLQDSARRTPARVPGAERLFQAYQIGGDEGADGVAAELARERRRDDPRRALRTA